MTTQSSSMQRVGIEKIWAYPTTMCLDLDELAAARGREPGYGSQTLQVDRRALNPCWEDPLTMAVNAAEPMLSDEDRQAIELLIIGTESSWDQGKPLSTWAHRFLRIQPHCRVLETKMACYGGTSALMMAAHWVASGVRPGAKALVIATDQSRAQLEFPSEFVMGAGAVAMLISDQPKVIELELGRQGYWAEDVEDTFRPTSTKEQGNEENSIYCYLEALAGAYSDFCRRIEGVDYERDFALHVYHVPFGGMTRLAHRHMLKGAGIKLRGREFEEHYQRKVGHTITYTRKLGGTYSAATFFALMGTLERSESYRPGDRLSVFSYGSGSCAELYSTRICPEARETVARAGLQQLIDARRQVTVEQYEAIERERTSYIDRGTYEPALDGLSGHFASHYRGQRKLVLRGLDDYFRRYDWS